MRSKAGIANRPKEVDWRFVQVSALSTLACFLTAFHCSTEWSKHSRLTTERNKSNLLRICNPLAAQASLTRWHSTGTLCASAVNWMHRQHSLACSRPDHYAHIRPIGCTDNTHSPAANRTSFLFSGQPDAQATFTRLQPTGPLCPSPPTGY
jgi:hypothetical protein